MPLATPRATLPAHADADPRSTQTLRVAAVSFFNSKPLIAGLDERPDVDLALDVPSRLLDRLRDQTAEVALLPVIDYQKLDGAVLLPEGGGIGCDGPTLTVRLFSKTPLHRIERLCCDTDSHTSVVLSRVLLKRLHGLEPQIAPLDDLTGDPGEARLLIGDKVVCEEPVGFDYQMDLGEAWKSLTGLPFVFACWTARAGAEVGELPRTLADCRRRGLGEVDDLIERFALPRGWPADIARRYLTEYLHFEVGPRQLEAIRLFHQFAHEDGLLENVRPLQTHEAEG